MLGASLRLLESMCPSLRESPEFEAMSSFDEIERLPTRLSRWIFVGVGWLTREGAEMYAGVMTMVTLMTLFCPDASFISLLYKGLSMRAVHNVQ